MKPYYQDDSVTLYHGDCRGILPQIRQSTIDVVLTDPPFFMPATHYQTRVTAQRSWGDTSILGTFWGVILDLLAPAMLPTGHLLAFCNGDSYPVFYPETYRRFDSCRSLIWDKGHFGMGSPWRNQHELILAARWSSSHRTERRGCPDVIRCAPIPSDQRFHPVEKPVRLLAELLQPITPECATVLDPFAGGGSTLRAAAAAGHSAIGIESEERYCEVIARRFDQMALDFGTESA